MWKESFELTSGDFPSTFHLHPSTSIRIIGPPGWAPTRSGQEIEDGIWEIGGDKIGKGMEYDPLLESKMGLFERYFRRVLAEDGVELTD